jgi:hypothetical protein
MSLLIGIHKLSDHYTLGGKIFPDFVTIMRFLFKLWARVPETVNVGMR